MRHDRPYARYENDCNPLKRASFKKGSSPSALRRIIRTAILSATTHQNSETCTPQVGLVVVAVARVGDATR